MRYLFTLFLLAVGTAQAQSLPDKPQPQKVINKDFIITFFVYGAALAADGITVLPQSPGCVESNPLLGLHPTPQRISAVAGGEFALSVAGGYILKKTFRNNHHWILRNVWRVEPYAQTMSHIHGAYENKTFTCQ